MLFDHRSGGRPVQIVTTPAKLSLIFRPIVVKVTG